MERVRNGWLWLIVYLPRRLPKLPKALLGSEEKASANLYCQVNVPDAFQLLSLTSVEFYHVQLELNDKTAEYCPVAGRRFTDHQGAPALWQDGVGMSQTKSIFMKFPY